MRSLNKGVRRMRKSARTFYASTLPKKIPQTTDIFLMYLCILHHISLKHSHSFGMMNPSVVWSNVLISDHLIQLGSYFITEIVIVNRDMPMLPLYPKTELG